MGLRIFLPVALDDQWSTTYIETNVTYNEISATLPIEMSTVYFNSMVLVGSKHYYGISLDVESAFHHKLVPNTNITLSTRSVMRNFYIGWIK